MRESGGAQPILGVHDFHRTFAPFSLSETSGTLRQSVPFAETPTSYRAASSPLVQRKSQYGDLNAAGVDVAEAFDKPEVKRCRARRKVVGG